MNGEYDAEAVEEKWREQWVADDTYAYGGDPDSDPDTVFAIDTPPPTVSGNIHWGNTYGFVLQDFVARFRRMRGAETFFPFGYDDNGIATERLTERELGIHHKDYSRQEFQQKVREVCADYEDTFTEIMQRLGCSMDWDHVYQTIEPAVQRLSQLSFVDLYEQGREYRQRAPAIWCPDCETAISQVEMEDAEEDAHYHDIEFPLVDPDTDRESLTISTTRPELLPACVAVFVHPDDEASADLVGETAEIPLFGHEVPVREDDRVDTETGTGVVMCCTFGDQTDIEWYQAHDLPLRVAIDESGTMTDSAGDYAGLSTAEARDAIVEDLEEGGYLTDREAVSHTVRVHERCDAPVEFLVTEQWYVRLLDRTDEYLEAGRSLEWYPEKMLTRYEHWLEGLEWDWCISRQRDSGIPFPVWYCADCGEEVLAEKADLPVDPMEDDPPVDSCSECGHGGFEPETDVFDTWATSSLTPLINAGWDYDEETGEYRMAHPELYPMDLRPQGHDIISFWLFHTVVKCYEHTGEVPFDAVMINGMVLDEDRRKMSKSRGNVVDPLEVLDEYPVDAARYWAAGTSVGDDFPFKEKDLVGGEKLLQKLWNASRLVDDLASDDRAGDAGAATDGGTTGDASAAVRGRPDDLVAIDRWLLAELDAVVADVTDALAEYEFSKARDRLRSFFWRTFCDDYLEIAKQRVREDESDSADLRSARYTLRTAHRTFLKLFAPMLPHVTEEIWTALYAGADAAGAGDEGRDGGGRGGRGGGETAPESVHRAAWPEPRGFEADREAGRTAMAVVSALRKYKTEHGLALNAPLAHVEVAGDVAGFEDAIAEAMHVAEVSVRESAPETTTEMVGVDLEYSLVGPEFGERVGEIEAAIEAGDFEVRDGELHAADAVLDPEMFAVEEERRYAGAGEMLEAGPAVVIVQE